MSEKTTVPVPAIPHRLIVIEGPIGVGKTSLARRLACSFGSELILEQADENPFLERFYKNPRSAALQTQLYFLFQRTRQLEDIRQHDLFDTVRVADYLIDKDRLFARLTLDDEEFALYDQVYTKLVVDPPVPDLVIYLQAPVDVLVERIERRGIRYEQHMDRTYLEKLQEAYARFFHAYDASPLLIVNAAQADFVANDGDYGQLLEQVCRIRRGRHFYNPLKSTV
jgi:deoxyguanosine kinase